MWKLALIFIAGAAIAQAPSFQPVGSMSQLMVNIIYPTSDALFYIERTPPKTDVDWGLISNQALMLAESGNLLMMPGRARDQGNWITDSKMLVDVGSAAYKLALAKNMDGILALNDQLNASCVVCHQQYRPDYRRRPPAQ
jgi:hypothetical protein